MKRLLLIILAALFIGGTAYVYFALGLFPKGAAVRPADGGSAEAIPSANEVPAITERVIAENDVRRMRAHSVRIPVLQFHRDPDRTKGVNLAIEEFAEERIADFIAACDESVLPATEGVPPSDLAMGWSPLLVSPTLVSFRFDSSEYLSGAAHPENSARAFTYDLAREQILDLDDIFASSSIALEEISLVVRERLRARWPELSSDDFTSQVHPGTEPTPENYRNIGITKEGFLVIFDPYQVAPYARGTQTVLISREYFGTLVRPEILEAMREAKENYVEAEPEE